MTDDRYDRPPAIVLRHLGRGRRAGYSAACSLCGRIGEDPAKAALVPLAEAHLRDHHDGTGRVVDLERYQRA